MAPQTRRMKAALEQASDQAAPSSSPTAASPNARKKKAKTATKAQAQTPAQDQEPVVEDSIDAVLTSETFAPSSPGRAENEDSDDEAPEEVSTNRAASATKKATQVAQKAALEKAAAEKRKRQDRDALFKRQAGERRKAEEERKIRSSGRDEAGDDIERPLQTQREAAGGRRREDRVTVPDLLPDNFLTDSSSEDEGEADGDDEPRLKKAKEFPATKTTLSRFGRELPDESVGSTVYRVAAGTDERIPPKTKTVSKNAKELLLRRNRQAVKARSGFLVK